MKTNPNTILLAQLKPNNVEITVLSPATTVKKLERWLDDLCEYCESLPLNKRSPYAHAAHSLREKLRSMSH